MSITSANAVFLITIPGVYSSPVQLAAFSADDMFSTEEVEPIELQMGADGVLTGGWVPTMNRMNITFLASSPSNVVFETWDVAQNQSRSIFNATGTVALLGTGRVYTLTKGFLSRVSRVPEAKKVLQPRRWGITWGAVTPGPQAVT
ncbi:MAG TPA: hypothetical protein VG248_03415 [Caulobacteraceae bacterium]|jgi:hypothetical protein|nr:hypothetical protein [Caulobacteraceae bacterium]